MATTLAPSAVLNPPLNLTATARSTEVFLNWKPNTGVVPTGYNIYWGKTSGGPYLILASDIKTTYFIDTGLANGATYFYVVTALNGTKESGFSKEVAVVPPSVSYFYVIEQCTLENLAETINRWNGSPYTLKFVFGLPGGYYTPFDTAFCIWEKAILPA